MNKHPFFSIIIPTYNRRSLIENAIDSVFAQTLEDFELIIIDDGSKDDTFSLVSKYEDNRIIYAYKQNGGQNSANNLALKIIRGEYVAFLDSDDIWMNDKLEKTYNMYQSDPEISVVYNYTGVYEDNDIVLARNDTLEGWCYKDVLEQGYLTSPSFLSCKRMCFDEIGEFDEEQRACQDDDLCFKLCKKYKVGLIKEILGVYGLTADDQIGKDNKRVAKYYFRLLEKYKQDILNYCGAEVMRKKYNRAMRLYKESGDLEMAESIKDLMDELK